MRWSYILFLLSLPFLLEVLIACCNCEQVADKTFATGALLVNNLDNSGATAVSTTADSIRAAVYGLSVQVVRNIMAEGCQSLHLVPGAYATSCDCGWVLARATQSLSEIRVLTRNALSENLPEGSDVSRSFRIDVDRVFPLSPLEAAFLYQPNSFFNLIDVPEDTIEDRIDFKLLLVDQPQFLGEHQFTVQLVYADGSTEQRESTPVVLIP